MGDQTWYEAEVLYSHRKPFAECMGYDDPEECFSTGDGGSRHVDFYDTGTQEWDGIETAAAMGLIFSGSHGAGCEYGPAVFLSAGDGRLLAFESLHDSYSPAVEVLPPTDQTDEKLQEQISAARVFLEVRRDIRERVEASEPKVGMTCPACGGAELCEKTIRLRGSRRGEANAEVRIECPACAFVAGDSLTPNPKPLPPRVVCYYDGFGFVTPGARFTRDLDGARLHYVPYWAAQLEIHGDAWGETPLNERPKAEWMTIDEARERLAKGDLSS